MGRRLVPRWCAWGLLLLLCAPLAWGQEESLLFMGEEGVTTPSRRPQPMDESAASVAVISREDIERSGALTIPDLLATVAGVDVIRLSEASAEVSIRGFNSYSSNKVLVMLDSRPLFNLADASVDWNLIPVSVADIDRIEIVRGPGSAMYGENAFFGIINIITRKPEGGGGSASGGSGGQSSQRVRAGTDDGRVRATVEALELDRFSEQRDEIQNDYLSRTGLDPIRARSSIQRGFFRTDIESGKVRLAASGGASREATDFFSFSNVDRAAFLGLDLFVPAGRVDLTASLRTGYRDQERDEAGFPQGPFRKNWRSDFELQGVYSPVLADVVVAGVQASYREVNDEIFFGPGPATRHQTVISGYLENQLANPAKTLFFSTGIRFDSYPEIGVMTSPQAGLIYLPTPSNAIKLNWGEAFRSPALYELYGLDTSAPPLIFQGNDSLRPEGISSWNLDWVYHRSNRVRLSAGLFYNQLYDLIVFRQVSVTPLTRTYRLENGSGGTSWGGQVEGRVRIAHGVELWGNYSHTRAYYLEGGDEIEAPFSPPDKANFGINVDVDRFSMSLWTTQISDYVGVTQNTPLQNRVDMGGISTANLRLEYRFTMKLSVEAVAMDLLGKGHYESPVYAPITPYYIVTVNYGAR